MFGLMYLLAAAVYLALMYFVVRWAWRSGRSGGGSIAKASTFASLGFLAVYLPIFWNHIPTVLMHRSMCAKEAGFNALIPAAQWRVQHSAAVDAVERLPREQRERYVQHPSMTESFERFTYFGGLLERTHMKDEISVWGIEVRRLTWRTLDAATGELLATATDFQSGEREDLRFWLYRPGCVQRPPTAVGQPVLPIEPLDHFQVYGRQLKGEQP